MVQKNVFWEAFLISIFIFLSGIFLGYLLESNRTEKVFENYQESELDLLDIKIQQEIFSLDDFNCDYAKSESINFADRVYEEAKQLELYESSSKLTKELVFQHKKYDLLRTILWLNLLSIKQKCDADFNAIVYFYEYQTESSEIKAKQAVFSKYLFELKQKKGNSLILIPIASNLDINSISFLMNEYDIKSSPAILVNENQTIFDISDLENIENLLN